MPDDRGAHPRRGLVLAARMMATSTAAVESTIIASAMPAIVADLSGATLYSWVFSAFLLAQAVTIPIYGRLADLYGRKRVFVAGAAMFFLGSLLCGLADGILALIFFRVVQGLGAGAVQPIAYTIVGDIYSPVERARVQGMLSGVFGLAAIGGPALGGFLVASGSWRLVFWINLPIVAAAIAMVIVFLRADTETRRHRLDIAGAVLLAIGIGAIVLAADRWRQIGAVNTLISLAAGLAALVALARHERSTLEPMIPAGLFRNQVIVVSSLGGFTVGATIMSVLAFLPSSVQAGMGRSAEISGIVLGIMMVVWTIGSIAAGRLMVYVPYRTLGCIGAVFNLLGTALLMAIAPNGSVAQVAIAVSVLGIGLGFCNTTWIVSVQTRVVYEQRGSATSSVLFMRFLGQALGAAVGGAILSLGLHLGAPDAADPLGALLDPSQVAILTEPGRDALRTAVSNAFRGVFGLTALMALATLFLALRLPKGLRAGTANPGFPMTRAEVSQTRRTVAR